MTTELLVLTFAALLQMLQFSAFSVAASQQTGLKIAMGARDTTITLTGTAGRLGRALDNHYAALTLFTIAVVVVSLADKSSGFTANCAWVYLGARILYVPAYVIGVPPWRSVFWFVGFFATLAMFVALLL